MPGPLSLTRITTFPRSSAVALIATGAPSPFLVRWKRGWPKSFRPPRDPTVQLALVQHATRCMHAGIPPWRRKAPKYRNNLPKVDRHGIQCKNSGGYAPDIKQCGRPPDVPVQDPLGKFDLIYEGSVTSMAQQSSEDFEMESDCVEWRPHLMRGCDKKVLIGSNGQACFFERLFEFGSSGRARPCRCGNVRGGSP